MAHPKRIAVPFHPRIHSSQQRCMGAESKAVPWAIIILLLLALVVIFGLWGKVPRRPQFPREAPAGKAPGTAGLVIR